MSLFGRAALSRRSYFALITAMHWCCISAHLYEEQFSIGEIAVAQACCEPVVQSSTDQRGSYFALTSAAVHWYCLTAYLYAEQISVGVIEVAQACCEPVFRAALSTGEAILPMSLLQCIRVASLHTCMQSKAPQV